MRQAQQAQNQGASGIDESTCEWSDSTVTTERSGESEIIAGMSAERVKVVATQSCRDTRSAQVCDFELTLDQWLAPQSDAAQEALAFYRAYAEKLGMGTLGSRDFTQRVESMFGGYTGLWSEVAGQLAAAEGYPVRSSLSLAVGGPQCQSSQELRTAERPAVPGVGEVVGGALGGALGGMLGRSRDASARKAAPPPEPVPAAPVGSLVRVMTIATEIISVSNVAADPASFAPPAGFRPSR
jgi:hypothetical protein